MHVPPREKPVTFLLLGDIKGTLEPCGCTSHPLGGIYRLGTLAERVRRASTGFAVLAAGDLLHASAAVDEMRAAQDEVGAATLTLALQKVGLWASARGELDRRAAPFFLEDGQTALREVGGLRVGAAALQPPRVPAPLVRTLRAQGAHVVVLLVHGDRAQARDAALAASGADFVLAGHATQPSARAERVGTAVVLEVGPDGERVGSLELFAPRPGEPFLDGEPRRKALEVCALRVRQARRKLLEARKHGAPAEAVRFLERNLARAQAERGRVRAELAAGRPVGRNHFLWRLVPLDRSIPDDLRLLPLRHAHKDRLREVNLRHAARFRAPKPSPKAATYRGNESCKECHGEAYDFWKQTKHAHAWETLVRDRSDHDLGCVGCHMTGYLQPGGSSLAERPELRAVGCETCHGPGSLHEDAPDEKKKSLIARDAPQVLCIGCHNAQHSDLFSYPAYRARILGPGHGQPVRKAGAP
jgi:hypothetical protein